MVPVINWKRLEKFVRQESQRMHGADADMVMDKLWRIGDLCGEGTQGRQAINRVAASLMTTKCKPVIIAPCCPDYTHVDGRYTFRGLSGGVSLLTSLHIQFLESLVEILPDATIRILIADQEAQDLALCQACGKSQEEFLVLVAQSIRNTQDKVASYGWQTEPFTQYMPDLLEQEREISAELLVDSEFSYQLHDETMTRAEMYARIGRFSVAEQLQRTARTASQYLALGRRVRQENGIVVNHTTTNLSWYARAEVAVLHNPVCVY